MVVAVQSTAFAMSFLYQAFGLRIESSFAIPGLVAAVEGPVEIQVGRTPPNAELDRILELPRSLWRTSPNRVPTGEPLLEHWRLHGTEGDYYFFSSHGGERVLIVPPLQTIWALSSVDELPEHTALYLVGPIFAFVLRMRGLLRLHGSAVASGEVAAAFSGQAGAGKSTTAAALVSHGCRLLADDSVVLAQRAARFYVSPGFPRLRLWPDVAPLVSALQENLPRMRPASEKGFLDLSESAQSFMPDPSALSVIYLLGTRSTDANAPRIESMSRRTALIECVKNVYMAWLSDRGVQARDFEFLSELVSRVPVRRVIPHADARTLPKLCELILADIGAI
jgi:hypothetical protein